jgi:hypothetical protein
VAAGRGLGADRHRHAGRADHLGGQRGFDHCPSASAPDPARRRNLPVASPTSRTFARRPHHTEGPAHNRCAGPFGVRRWFSWLESFRTKANLCTCVVRMLRQDRGRERCGHAPRRGRPPSGNASRMTFMGRAVTGV